VSDNSEFSTHEISANNTIAGFQAVLQGLHKVKVSVDLFENHGHPNLQFTLKDCVGSEISCAFIIKTVDQHIDFTLHIRQPDPQFPLTVECISYIDEDDLIDKKELQIL
jgi:hypothetical protein